MQYVSGWNVSAGEEILYLPRHRLAKIGPPPFAPDSDWWFVDDLKLVVISYDAEYKAVETVLIEDEPEVEMAKRWRELVTAEAAR